MSASRYGRHTAALRGTSGTSGTVIAVLSAILCCWVLVPSVAHAVAAPLLTDDAGGAALFTGTDPLTPGAPRSACVQIAATGAEPADQITFTATDLSGALPDYLTIRAEAGTGGRYGDCTGFTGQQIYQGPLRSLAATPGDGIDTGWTPASDPARTFRITIGVDSSSSALGRAGGASFSWRLIRTAVPAPTDTPVAQPTTVAPGPVVTPSAGTGSPPPSSAVESGAPGPAGVSSTPPTAPTSASAPSGAPHTTGPGGPIATVDVPATGASPAGPSTWALTRQQIFDMIQHVLDQPGFTLGPLLIAVLFLLTQHLIDMRDPKLAAASRTKREMMLRFPLHYRDALGDRQPPR